MDIKIKIKKEWNEMNNSEKMAMVKFFPEEAKTDDYWGVRLEYFRANGFTEEAKTDTDWYIRREYFRANGFTEEAKTDDYWGVRLQYFRANGFTEEARTDPDSSIRREAKIYFSLITEKKVTEKRTIVLDGVTYKEI